MIERLKKEGRAALNERDFEGDDQRFQFSFRKRESLKEKREFFLGRFFLGGGGRKRVFLNLFFNLNFADLGKCECLNY